MWRAIPDYLDYKISDSGEIIKRGQIIKQRTRKDGRKQVNLNRHGLKKTYLTHRLVASAFLDLPLNSIVTVDHIDGDKTNNSIRNLRCISRKDNIILHHIKERGVSVCVLNQI